MFFDLCHRVIVQALIVLGVEIGLIQFGPIYEYMTVADLNSLAGQAYNALDIALFRIVRIPKNDDITTLKMSPADALYPVIDEFVDQQTLAIMQLRQHRRALDDHGLNKENTDQDKNDDDQK